VTVPEVVGVYEPACGYPERWSVVRWIDGAHPAVLDRSTPVDVHRVALAEDLAELLLRLHGLEVPLEALDDADLRWYRAEPLARMDSTTRANIGHCRGLGEFDVDFDAVERVWDEAMRLPGVARAPLPRWHHADLAAENLLLRDDRLAAVLDFGGLAVGDPTVDLIVAWEVLDPPARDVFRRTLGVDEATWRRGRAWALSISLMIWYYWATMPERRASRIAVVQNVLADAR
jgi:aminoglycoside phosphotransferase (APT) family kinase protein